jgi:putative transposase
VFQLKGRVVRREEFETIDQVRTAIDSYIDTYHHRRHSGLG